MCKHSSRFSQCNGSPVMTARIFLRTRLTPLLLFVLSICGCATRNHSVQSEVQPKDRDPISIAAQSPPKVDGDSDHAQETQSSIRLTATDESDLLGPSIVAPESELPPAPGPATDELPDPVTAVTLDKVIESVYFSYPLLESALYSRNIAEGEQLAAWGEFDLKLKASTANGPVGYYETYRHTIGATQPTWNGGEVFAGYRVGRGYYQPWYLERQTNDGGEFKVGASIPLLRNRDIDDRRAGVWNSDYGRQIAEPDIQAQLIGFVLEASYVYWDWVAASRKQEIYSNLLRLAEDRMERIRRQVEEGFLDPPELTDNRRLVADRKAKLADAQRKFQQTGIKLSLFYRDASGKSIIPSIDSRPTFPQPQPISEDQLESDLLIAYQNRPELVHLDLKRQQLNVDYANAENDLLPNLDAVITGSQDVGLPTSSKRDKSPFELEAGLFADVPLQRRKAHGKLAAIEAKLAQLQAKRQLTTDKIAVEVRNAYVALDKAYQQVLETRLAVALAEDLARRESRNEELGLSDMLKVSLREQYAVESAVKQVDALTQYHKAQADYRAALALDQLN